MNHPAAVPIKPLSAPPLEFKPLFEFEDSLLCALASADGQGQPTVERLYSYSHKQILRRILDVYQERTQEDTTTKSDAWAEGASGFTYGDSEQIGIGFLEESDLDFLFTDVTSSMRPPNYLIARFPQTWEYINWCYRLAASPLSEKIHARPVRHNYGLGWRPTIREALGLGLLYVFHSERYHSPYADGMRRCLAAHRYQQLVELRTKWWPRFIDAVDQGGNFGEPYDRTDKVYGRNSFLTNYGFLCRMEHWAPFWAELWDQLLLSPQFDKLTSGKIKFFSDTLTITIEKELSDFRKNYLPDSDAVVALAPAAIKTFEDSFKLEIRRYTLGMPDLHSELERIKRDESLRDPLLGIEVEEAPPPPFSFPLSSSTPELELVLATDPFAFAD